jgi:NAD-dependent DNA ligase
MPLVPYKWNETNIDILLENIEEDDTVREKNITGFFKGIGVEGLSSGNITRIINAGYDSVPNIVKMSTTELLKVDGFQIKLATKIHEGIKDKLEAASLVTLMSSSNLFGRGFSEKKLEIIIEAYPNILLSTESDLQKKMNIVTIKGIAEKSAEAFVERIDNFIDFIKEINLEYKMLPDNKQPSATKYDKLHPLYNKTIVMTGFRDNQVQDLLKKIGVKLGSSVSQNTFLVLVKNEDGETGKLLEAKKLGLPIMNIEDFRKKYLK